jgi:hypothetical protein
MLFCFVDLATAQRQLVFANQGPGFSLPFRDTYGCLLGDSWKAELMVGPSPSEVIWPAALPTPFVSSNGCATGFFNGGIVDLFLPPDGTVYARVRMWQGAETFEEAVRAGTAEFGLTPIVAVQTTASGSPSYLTGLLAPWVGPLTPWFMTEIFTTNYFPSPHPVVVPAGHELQFVIVKPLLARKPSDFRWQKLNSESNWVDIVGANTNFLYLKSVGTNDAGEYRAVFDFGCGCLDNIGEVGITIFGVDGHEGPTLIGPPGGKYQVYFKDVLGSSNDWQILTNVVLTTGSLSRIDPEFPNSSQRFYRVVYPFQ